MRLLLSRYPYCFALALVFAANGTAQERLTYDQIASNTFSTAVESAPPKPDGGENEQASQLKNPISKHGVTNFDVYRDINTYPIDPRKPCHLCIQRKGTGPKAKERHDKIYGFQGRPYRDVEPGTCLCGKKKQKFKFTNINVYWPSSFAGIWEDKFPVLSDLNNKTINRCRAVNIFDNLGGFELSRYQRKDNGFCGPGYDRYGCLGESKAIAAGLPDGSCSQCSESSVCGGDCSSGKGCVCAGRNRHPNWNPN